MKTFKAFLISFFFIYIAMGVVFSVSARVEWVPAATFWDKLSEHMRLAFVGNIFYQLLVSAGFAIVICILLLICKLIKASIKR